ncbi:hypothetical protein Taro_043739 [Colocasia esculenta]|uniref:Uncharacterized protein n=1 Tax=Colocasia esculenta TaxID=4460 RepID=A0A843X4I4_COLES|nr:hypothetical protein [Colocasia esculenta]
MVCGGCSGRGSTSSGAPFTSVGQGVHLPDYTGCPGNRVRLPDYANCPGNRGREPSSSGGGGGSASWTPAMLNFWRRYMFTRPEDLPRAQVVWESTAQTNFIKSMWEARDKAAKTTGNEDPMAWMDYSPERSQAAKRNQAAHPEKNVHTSGSVSYATHSQKLRHDLERAPTFRELFDRTHKQKGTDDYVNKSARTIAETYDRTMADRYVEGTPQPNLDPEAWVDTMGGPSVRLWGQPGYYSSVVLICEFDRSSGLRKFICCDARQWWR